MKTSKFFLSTLIAASAMTATAWADYTWDNTKNYAYSWDFSNENTQNGQTGVLGGVVTNTFVTEYVEGIGTAIQKGNSAGGYWEADTNSFFYNALQDVTSGFFTGSLTFSFDYYYKGSSWGETLFHFGKDGTGLSIGLAPNGYVSIVSGTGTDSSFRNAQSNVQLAENSWNSVTLTISGREWFVAVGENTSSSYDIGRVNWATSDSDRNKYSLGVQSPGDVEGVSGLNDSGCKLANVKVDYVAEAWESVFSGVELTWNGDVSENWSDANWSGRDGNSFQDGDSVIFGNSDKRTISLEAGNTIIVDNMTVSGGEYKLILPANNTSATIKGRTLTINENAKLRVGAPSVWNGNEYHNIALKFDEIDLKGTLSLETKSTDMWSTLSFSNENAVLDITDVGGSDTNPALSIDYVKMNTSGKITSDWGKLVSIGNVEGSGNLTIESPSAPNWVTNIVYNVSGLKNYTGNLLLTKGTGTGTLTVNVSGSNDTFSGYVDISAGTLKLASKGSVLGEEDLSGEDNRYAVVVREGGVLDINGQQDTSYKFELKGGLLVNNGGNIGTSNRQISGLKLSAASTVGGTGNFGLISGQWGGNVLDLGGYTLTKTGSNYFWLTGTRVTNGMIDVRDGRLFLINGKNGNNFSMDDGAKIRIDGGVVAVHKSEAEGSSSVALGDVEIALTDANINIAKLIQSDSANATFSVQAGSILYLDVTDLTLNGTEDVSLTIAGANAISSESFFDQVLVGSYDEQGAWINSEWYYLANSWNSETGTLTLTIPEPSAFGLLAGVGALALVASRRRRSRR